MFVAGPSYVQIESSLRLARRKAVAAYDRLIGLELDHLVVDIPMQPRPMRETSRSLSLMCFTVATFPSRVEVVGSPAATAERVRCFSW
jgi:hypothetical protein